MNSERISDPSRTGAVWVTAVGALLVFAAAVIFVAVRWAEIPDGMKLGALAALSGGLLVAGRTLRSTPVTARVLYQLGALLVPVTGAAVLVHLEVSWELGLGFGGVVAAIGLWALARLENHDQGAVSILDVGALVMAVASTVGLAALTNLPAPLILAGGATAALAFSADRTATAWALTAGLAPLLAPVGPAVGGSGWTSLVDAATTPSGPASAAGVIVGGVLLVVAHRHRSLTPIVPALAAPVLSLTPAVAGSGATTDQLILGLAALLVIIETAAVLTRDDPFWRRPTRISAIIAELTAGPVLLLAAGATAFLGLVSPQSMPPSLPAASLVAAVAWLLADARHTVSKSSTAGIDTNLRLSLIGADWRTPGWPEAAAASLGSLAAGIVGLVPAGVAAMALVAIAGIAGLARRPGTVTASMLILGTAPLILNDRSDWVPTLALALAAAVLAAEVGVRRAAAVEGRRWSDLALPILPLLTAAVLLSPLVDPALLAPGLVAALALLAVRLDQAGPGTAQGWIGRGAAVSVLGVVVFSPDPVDTAITAGLVLLISGTEATRLRTPAALYGAIPALPLLVGASMAASGLGEADIGLGLVIAGIATGLAATAVALEGDRRWAVPVGLTTAALIGPGLALAALGAVQMGTALVLIGVAAIGVGLVADRAVVAVAGGAIGTAGVWTLLDAADVIAIDAYAVPVAVTLLIAGLTIRGVSASSWVRSGPGTGLLVMATLAERIGGSGGAHGIAAGAVAIAAVAAGAWWRQAAPLLLGTLTLLVLVGYESLAVTAGLPTWVWLASGGAVLITAGLLMERAEQGPVETGRRITDTLAERYA